MARIRMASECLGIFSWLQGRPNALDGSSCALFLPQLYTPTLRRLPADPVEGGGVCSRLDTVDEFVARIAWIEHVRIHDM
jgi:hypothetical protein